MKRTLSIAASLLVVGASLVAAVSPAAAAPAGDFYETPSTLPAADGDIIRHEPAAFYLDPLKVLKAPATVNRIMYRSTDAHGDPVAVTGTVLTPTVPWIGKGERPLVGYAVGTQGLGDQCAPSRQLAAGSEYEGAFLSGLLTRGYGVVVPDYQGLGTAGVHTYIVRRAQAAAVLDGVRAAQRLRIAGLPVDGPVALSGFSQGGGASAAAAELQPSYAPELDLVGAYAGAVPAELTAVARHIDGTLYTGFLLYALNGLASAYDLDLTAELNAAGEQAVLASRQQCTVESIASYPFVRTSSFSESGESLETIMGREPYKAIVAEQRIGLRKPAVPTLVIGSVLDDVVPYGQVKAMAKSWCAKGSKVRFRSYLSPTHVGTAVAAFPESFAFLEARFAGVPFTSSCGSL